MKTITEKIDDFVKAFPNMTKEEADYIQEILRWDDETKAAFFFAKRIFEDKDLEETKE